jgi:lipopolysaccharide export system protein LptA
MRIATIFLTSLFLVESRVEAEPAADTLRLTADQMECHVQKNTCYALGNAIAKQGTRTIKAGRFTARFKGENGAGFEIEQLVAEKEVLIRAPEHELVVQADQAEYNLAQNQLTLTGNVKVTRGKDQLNGEKGTVDLTKGVFKVHAGTSGRSTQALITSLPKARKKN